jgi:medium-chain acyl-[acyl-carrier-protein] hydrolase
MTELKKEFTHKFFLTAGECNAELEMPVTLFVSRVIEISTMQANNLGIGYSRLIEDNTGWVLSRVTFEMKRYPTVNEEYTFTTWVESFNRHFSQRDMEVRDARGEVIGYVRTIWMIINFATREGVDLTKLNFNINYISTKECPIPMQPRQAPVNATRTAHYKFQYSDFDFNRHVNTVRYVELLLNQFPLEKYDEFMVNRLEMAFYKESRYGETASVLVDDSNPLDCRLSVDVDAVSHCRARFIFVPRK